MQDKKDTILCFATFTNWSKCETKMIVFIVYHEDQIEFRNCNFIPKSFFSKVNKGDSETFVFKRTLPVHIFIPVTTIAHQLDLSSIKDKTCENLNSCDGQI